MTARAGDLDVILTVRVRAAAEGPKRPREDDDDEEGGTSFCLHSCVLNAKSVYFRERLSASMPSPSSGRLELDEWVDDGDDVGGLDVLLRSMYDASGMATVMDVVPTPILLVRALGLADRFCVVPACKARMADALLLGLGGVSVALDDAFVTAFFRLALRCLPPQLAPLVETCRDRLWELYSDVPEVIRVDELRASFCALPHAAVLAWLRMGDDLMVHSENCVVLLLCHWMDAHESCGKDDLYDLALEVRVGDVGPTFSLMLPRLRLFKRLQRELSVMMMHRLKRERDGAAPFPTAAPLAAWTAPRRSPPPDDAPHPGEVTLTLSTDCSKEAFVPRPAYTNGFWVDAGLAPVGPELQQVVRVRPDLWPSSLRKPWSKVGGCVPFAFAASLGTCGSYGTFVNMQAETAIRNFDELRHCLVKTVDATDVSAFMALFMEGGGKRQLLSNSITIRSMDNNS